MVAFPNTVHAAISDRAIRSFAEQIRGEVIRPGDAAYDQARRVWNAAVDRYPALIVRPLDANDVRQAVAFARGHDLPLAVRGGGHSVAGHGAVDGGLVVDLSRLTRFALDAGQRAVWAETGLTWGEFNALGHDAGLATPGPDVAAVGLGGLTLGGGFGLLSRQYGMTIDNLLAVDVVTADGQLLTTSPAEHPDLFWALRGGGGNFGIATRFRFQMHPVGDVVGGVLVYPATREELWDYAAVAAAAPDALTTITFVGHAPPLPFIPSEAHGTLVHLIMAAYAGADEDAEQAFAPLKSLGGRAPLADTVGPIPYPALFDVTEMASVSRPQAIRAGLFPALDEATIDAVLEAVNEATSPFSQVMLRLLGGAIARVPAAATAFSHRDKPLYLAVNNAWDPAQEPRPERQVAWTEALWQSLAPRAAGAYANFLGDEGEDRVRAAYAPENFIRLAEIKRRYDPDNVFRLNANIPPA